MRYFAKAYRNIGIVAKIGVILIPLGIFLPSAVADEVKADTDTGLQATDKPFKTFRPGANEASISPGHRYFVEFRSRAAASYGHMYVLYGQVNDRGEIIRSAIAGLHPAGDANDCINCSVIPWTIGHIIFVPAETGASDGDLEEKYVTSRYRVMLDAAKYKKVFAYIKKLQAENPLWNALWRNCVSFGKDIAQYIGLQTPAFIWLEPKDFVDGLREMNGGRLQDPLADAAISARGRSTTSPLSLSRRDKTSAGTKKPAGRPAASSSTLRKNS